MDKKAIETFVEAIFGAKDEKRFWLFGLDEHTATHITLVFENQGCTVEREDDKLRVTPPPLV